MAFWMVIGLTLNLAGMILLFVYGMPKVYGTPKPPPATPETVTGTIVSPERAAELRMVMRGKIRGYGGLAFIITGTLLQIIAVVLDA
jgi:hypothetical protein